MGREQEGKDVREDDAEEREEPRKRKTKRRTLRWNHVIVERFNWSGARSAPRWREDEITGQEGGLHRGGAPGGKEQDWRGEEGRERRVR